MTGLRDLPVSNLPVSNLPVSNLMVSIAGDDPQAVNVAVRAAVECGAAEVVLSGGVLSDSEPLGRALAGLPLDRVAVGLDAGFDGPDAANALAVVAKGTPRAKLMFHMDPITALAVAGVSPLPIGMHLAQAAATADRHAGAYPDATFFLASGRAVRAAGGSAGEELGFIAACAVAYAKVAVEAGLPAGRALEGMVLAAGPETNSEALRRIWAVVTSGFGCDVPVRIETRSAPPLSADDDRSRDQAEVGRAAFEQIERDGGVLAWLGAGGLRH